MAGMPPDSPREGVAAPPPAVVLRPNQATSLNPGPLFGRKRRRGATAEIKSESHSGKKAATSLHSFVLVDEAGPRLAMAGSGHECKASGHQAGAGSDEAMKSGLYRRAIHEPWDL